MDVLIRIAAILPASDWLKWGRAAAWAALAGQNPYAVAGLYNPPWVLAALIPPALLPEPLDRLALFALCLVMLALSAWAMKAGRVALVMFLVSPPVFATLILGNVDAVPLVGLALPPVLALFAFTVKPQVGAGLAVWTVAEVWRRRGPRAALLACAPLAAATALWLAAWGLPRIEPEITTGAMWNWSLWPWAVPVGAGVLAWAVWKRDVHGALVAGPLLVPYFTQASLAGVMLALVRTPRLMAAVWAVWWVIEVVRWFSIASR